MESMARPSAGDAVRAERSAALSLGIMLPQEEGPGDPPPSWEYAARAAHAAEASGFDSVWLVDHFLWPEDPWDRAPARFGQRPSATGYGALEAWTTISALAAVTKRVRLGTVVTCTRYRNPALLAKMADNVHAISGGRLVLGLGSGDNFAEHEMFGYQTDRPVSHFEEALSVIVPLLREGRVEFKGEFYRANAVLQPRRGALGPPLIMIGALRNRPRMLGLVARFADMWNGWLWATSADAVRPAREAVDAACIEAGRDVRSLRRSMVCVVALDGPMAEMQGVITGSDEDIAETLVSFRAEGIDEVQIRLFPNDHAAIRRFSSVIRHVKAPATS